MILSKNQNEMIDQYIAMIYLEFLWFSLLNIYNSLYTSDEWQLRKMTISNGNGNGFFYVDQTYYQERKMKKMINLVYCREGEHL